MKPRTRVLIIEDDHAFAGRLKEALEAAGYEVAVVLRGDHGLRAAQQNGFAVVISALQVPGLSGLDVLDQLRRVKPRLPVILMTAVGTSDRAIEARRLGAYKYIEKPFEITRLLDLVAQAADCHRPASGLLEPGAADSSEPALVGRSPAMQSLYDEIGQAARASMNVLIRGETGTGKELVAQAIHRHSSRVGQPFVDINCTAIPETLLESEFFGHERGAFTGAHARHIGHFERAGAGTLFLDEIGDLNPGAQAKLLRVLQEKRIQRLGGNGWIAVDARVLAATNCDLESAIRERQFRNDLFFRLSVLNIRVPPLRERLEDIPDLVRHCLHRFSAEAAVPTPAVHVEAVGFLRRQPWPGNVRELQNVLRQAGVLAGNRWIGLAHVQEAYARNGALTEAPEQSIASYMAGLVAKARRGEITNAYAQMTEDMGRQLLAEVIRAAQGNQVQAARWLGVTPKTLHEKLTSFGLRPPVNRHTHETTEPS